MERASTGATVTEDTPPVPAGVFGPGGIGWAVETLATTCSIRSPEATAMVPEGVVHPVSVVVVTPVQVMIDAAVGVGVWVRSTKGPGTSSSGEPAPPLLRSPEWVACTAIVLPVVWVTESAAVANESGSRPTFSLAGRPASGLVDEGVTACTSSGTSVLSPAARCSV